MLLQSSIVISCLLKNRRNYTLYEVEPHRGLLQHLYEVLITRSDLVSEHNINLLFTS